MRVLLAPVRSGEAHALSGYVLLLDDITLEQEEQARLDRRMLELTEASRASVASVQAALDMLDYPDLEPAEREGFQGIVRAEVTAMSARLDKVVLIFWLRGGRGKAACASGHRRGRSGELQP